MEPKTARTILAHGPADGLVDPADIARLLLILREY
jgi:hypothetical protein